MIVIGLHFRHLYRVSWYTGGPVRDRKAHSETDCGFQSFISDAVL
jgi:hypothetical protein